MTAELAPDHSSEPETTGPVEVTPEEAAAAAKRMPTKEEVLASLEESLNKKVSKEELNAFIENKQ